MHALRRSATAAVLLTVSLLAGCTSSSPSSARVSPAPSPATASGSPAPPETLRAAPAAFTLPTPVSRAVVLPDGPNLLIAGGLTAAGGSTASVLSLNPVTGATGAAGSLAAPLHDAAGAVLAGHDYVFGGGEAVGSTSVQQLQRSGTASVVGRLPRLSSDLSAVTVGGTAYLLGGYDGSSYAAAVLATRDGVHLTPAARLPVPVRYAAAAATGHEIWLFGGRTPAGPTDVIQRIDVDSGRASIAGRLPHTLTDSTAVALGGRVFLAGGQVPSAGAAGGYAPTSDILSFDPADGRTAAAGRLPEPVADAGAAMIGTTAYLVGGEDSRALPAVTALSLVPAAKPADPPWATPASGPGRLAPGSDPSVLPGDLLIADRGNNRLLVVDPQGRVRWRFPRPGGPASGQSFLVPDDAFFSADGRSIVATEEDDSVISVVDPATGTLTYRYGRPGQPGSGPDQLHNPDDALLLPGGDLLSADIINCRLLLVHPPAHTPARIFGQTTNDCLHNPPNRFGSPNGAFPLTDGHYLVTEINGDWVDEMDLGGHVLWSTHPPGVVYPSDSNELSPGRYLTVDYSSPGQILIFDRNGNTLWRYAPTGSAALDHPSLALPLPNGDILANDDRNDRVIVVDPRTDRIVWQYGHTGAAGSAAGFLNNPDGVDLAPPNSLLAVHAATLGRP